MKRIKKIAIISLISFLGIFLLGVVLAWVYEEDVKEYAIAKINENLKTEFTVSSSSFSVWSKFPNASLELKDVYIEDTFEGKDTLLFAESVYLEFDLFNLFSGEYEVNEVSINDSQINLKWKENREDNYHFWKESESSDASFSFNIQTINISNSKFILDQEYTQTYIESEIHHIVADGAFEDKIFDLNLVGNLTLNSIQLKDKVYANHNELSVDSSIKIDSENSEYTFKGSQFELDQMLFSANGVIQNYKGATICSLTFTGRDQDIENSLKLMPEHLSNSLEGYRVSGNFDAVCSIKGKIDATNLPDIKLEFDLNDCEFKHYKSGVSLGNIVSMGVFEKRNKESERLVLANFVADLEGGAIKMSGEVSKFSSPAFDLNILGNFNLEDARNFAELENLNLCEGNLSIDGKIAGRINDIQNITASDINGLNAKGEIVLKDASIQTKEMSHALREVNGMLSIDGKSTDLRALFAKIENSDIKLEGKINNLLPYLLVDNQKLFFDAKLTSGLMDFNNLLDKSEGSSEENYSLIFPKDIDFNFKFDIGHLTFREFNALELVGTATLKDQIFTVDPFEFNSSDGQIRGSLMANGRKQEAIDISTDLKIVNIDINNLFGEFENFGQVFLTQNNIKGKATADIEFSTRMNSKLEMSSKDITSLIDIKIENGELIELSSMEEIGKYIRSNKLMAPLVNVDRLDEKLHHIFFSEMTNTVEIKNQRIIIPDMVIYSSAMDISVEGAHYFDNKIDYTLGFSIRDILSKEKDSPFGEIEDDGLGNSFFLAMKGTTANPSFSYDRLAHKSKRQEDRQNEKEVFKEVLKDGLKINQEEEKKKEEPKKVTIVVEHEDKKKEEKKKRWFDDDDEEGVKGNVPIDEDDDF